MTRDEAKAQALADFMGYCGGEEINRVWAEGFDDGWEAALRSIAAQEVDQSEEST